jgi:mRNA interferase MazF
VPRRGEIWLFKPDPVVGREQAGIRPGVIVSVDELNESDRGLVVIVPLTTRIRDESLYPLHVAIPAQASGLGHTSVAMCEQVRSVSSSRVYGRRPRGFVPDEQMNIIEASLRELLGL